MRQALFIAIIVAALQLYAGAPQQHRPSTVKAPAAKPAAGSRTKASPLQRCWAEMQQLLQAKDFEIRDEDLDEWGVKLTSCEDVVKNDPLKDGIRRRLIDLIAMSMVRSECDSREKDASSRADSCENKLGNLQSQTSELQALRQERDQLRFALNSTNRNIEFLRDRYERLQDEFRTHLETDVASANRRAATASQPVYRAPAQIHCTTLNNGSVSYMNCY
jgi:chromosome segregation ATPase